MKISNEMMLFDTKCVSFPKTYVNQTLGCYDKREQIQLKDI